MCMIFLFGLISDMLQIYIQFVKMESTDHKIFDTFEVCNLARMAAASFFFFSLKRKRYSEQPEKDPNLT